MTWPHTIFRSATRLSQTLVMALLAVACFGLSVSVPANANAQPSREQMVKAAILYNLARFSEWPEAQFEDTNSDFKICVQATDVLRPALQSLDGKPIKGRAVSLLAVDTSQVIDAHCHVFYLSSHATENIDLIDLADHGVLTVSDAKRFIKAGGSIALQRHDSKIGFSISQTTMKRAHIEPSSKILKLAVEVR